MQKNKSYCLKSSNILNNKIVSLDLLIMQNMKFHDKCNYYLSSCYNATYCNKKTFNLLTKQNSIEKINNFLKMVENVK